jgi:hypothetical protein
VAEDAFAVARRGRRRANTAEPREHRVVLKVTASELALLESLARAQGVSKQAVLMRAVLTGGVDAAARYERLREDLSAARLVLANVANNVNQLAHQANSFALGGGDPVDAADVQRALAEVRAVIARVDAVAAGSGEGDAG